jgi:hypothetical protein
MRDLLAIVATLASVWLLVSLRADTALADSLLQVCRPDEPCTVKQRYELLSVCQVDRASEANVVTPQTKVECIPADRSEKSVR